LILVFGRILLGRQKPRGQLAFCQLPTPSLSNTFSKKFPSSTARGVSPGYGVDYERPATDDKSVVRRARPMNKPCSPPEMMVAIF
jgi:hypothetical protein